MKKNIEELKKQSQIGISVEETGKRILQLMERNGFSIREISELMNVSYQAVRKWIKGESVPDISNLYIESIFGYDGK